MVGDPETVAERLSRDVAALQPYHLSAYMGLSGLPGEDVVRSVTLVGERGLPRLRAIAAERAAAA
jgi:hypothetical protein